MDLIQALHIRNPFCFKIKGSKIPVIKNLEIAHKKSKFLTSLENHKIWQHTVCIPL